MVQVLHFHGVACDVFVCLGFRYSSFFVHFRCVCSYLMCYLYHFIIFNLACIDLIFSALLELTNH